MILRTTSAPVSKSFVSATQEADLGRPENKPKTRPVSMCFKKTTSDDDLIINDKRLSMSRDDGDKKKKKLSKTTAFSTPVVIDEKEETASGGGEGGGGGFWCWKNGRKRSMEEFYQDMIKTYPGNALLHANYAKFLKEVSGDVAKAEEYCERAMILAKGNGGIVEADVLSLYGDLIWNSYRDAARARSYFDQALQSSPDDCYVLASYARFLWDADQEDDDED